MEFERTLHDLGFELVRRSRGALHYAKRANPFLSYYVQALPDGSTLFTWEFAIAEYMATRGLQVGSDEHLNTFLYPREDARGPQDGGWVAAQIDRVEEELRAVSFVEAGPEPADPGPSGTP